ncbi:hypothetical protein GCM10010404_73940 [Nonomuraea africana]
MAGLRAPVVTDSAPHQAGADQDAFHSSIVCALSRHQQHGNQAAEQVAGDFEQGLAWLPDGIETGMGAR